MTPDRPPRVFARLAAYIAVTLAVLTGGFLWFAYSSANRGAERAVRFHATFLAETLLRQRLRPADFAAPAHGARLAALDRFFRREVLADGALRVKLFSPTGIVVYSNQHRLIGSRPDEPAVQSALVGRPSFEVSRLNRQGGTGPNVKTVEVYIPVRLGKRRAAGVFELYQEYAPVAADAQAAVEPVLLGLVPVLGVLFAALVPLLARLTRRLREHVDAIEYSALHDDLTGLPNRIRFRDRIAQALLDAHRDEQAGFALLLLDLDRFKDVNNTLGHESGDRVLEEVARRLRDALRSSDTVARLGGDEFAILARGARDPDSALAVAGALRSALETPLTVSEVLLDLEASIGIVVAPAHGEDAETLLRRADIAMYLAKERHTGAELYDPDHDHHSPERLQLVAELRAAIAEGELVCHYQPQAALADGKTSAVEALVRWPHPRHGLLAPGQFVPLAERTGLIRALTSHVLREAIGQCQSWYQEGLELPVWVNITSRDLLDHNLPDEIAALLAQAALPAHLLGLEITENTILADPQRARTILDRLSQLGVHLAIDDFGSGNSSLAYLKRLPLHTLKIDKSFVQTMDTDPDNHTIVRSTIDLAHNLGLTVIAEGVETLPTWNQLARLGCDTAQGYHLSRPEPAHTMTGQAAGTRAHRRPVRPTPKTATT